MKQISNSSLSYTTKLFVTFFNQNFSAGASKTSPTTPTPLPSTSTPLPSPSLKFDNSHNAQPILPETVTDAGDTNSISHDILELSRAVDAASLEIDEAIKDLDKSSSSHESPALPTSLPLMEDDEFNAIIEETSEKDQLSPGFSEMSIDVGSEVSSPEQPKVVFGFSPDISPVKTPEQLLTDLGICPEESAPQNSKSVYENVSFDYPVCAVNDNDESADQSNGIMDKLDIIDNAREYEEITLKKQDGMLGITLTYGSDSLQNSIFVDEIKPGSPAAIAGKPLLHDQILKINNLEVGVDIMCTEAIALLTDDQLEVNIELARPKKHVIKINRMLGQSLGMMVAVSKVENDKSVIISTVDPNGLVARYGLFKGLTLHKVNEIELAGLGVKQVVEILAGCVGTITLTVFVHPNFSPYQPPRPPTPYPLTSLPHEDEYNDQNSVRFSVPSTPTNSTPTRTSSLGSLENLIREPPLGMGLSHAPDKPKILQPFPRGHGSPSINLINSDWGTGGRKGVQWGPVKGSHHVIPLPPNLKVDECKYNTPTKVTPTPHPSLNHPYRPIHRSSSMESYGKASSSLDSYSNHEQEESSFQNRNSTPQSPPQHYNNTLSNYSPKLSSPMAQKPQQTSFKPTAFHPALQSYNTPPSSTHSQYDRGSNTTEHTPPQQESTYENLRPSPEGEYENIGSDSSYQPHHRKHDNQLVKNIPDLPCSPKPIRSALKNRTTHNEPSVKHKFSVTTKQPLTDRSCTTPLRGVRRSPLPSKPTWPCSFAKDAVHSTAGSRMMSLQPPAR